LYFSLPDFLDTLKDIPGTIQASRRHNLTPSTEVKPASLSRDQLIVEELGAELMIYDQKRNQAFCLNQKAALVFQYCDGKTTVAGIAARLAQTLDEPVDEKVVQFALQSLSQDGLLEPLDFPQIVAASMTRREVMRKIGVRAAVALPLVTTLLVATPKAHASGWNNSGGRPPKKKW
jgi:Coenzyme PQQ synthesis protein D (PqqD)